jgi:hypothetical protein
MSWTFGSRSSYWWHRQRRSQSRSRVLRPSKLFASAATSLLVIAVSLDSKELCTGLLLATEVHDGAST